MADAFGRATPPTTDGSAMCTICGFAGDIQTDVNQPAGVATAFAFAVHFAAEHPEVRGGVSAYVLMAPTAESETNR